MLTTYAVGLPGPTHIDRGICCQDAHACAMVNDELVVAAVADGLGSESHSEIGSSVAAVTAVELCRERLTDVSDVEGCLATMREAFAAANDAVAQAANDMGEPLDQFDTTLCLAIFDGDRLLWGNAGDSGMVAALRTGEYEAITRQQRDDEGRVYPLCFDARWEFGARDGVASLALCTDGVLENLAPPILRKRWRTPIDTMLARMFLEPLPGDAANVAAIQSEAEEYLKSYPRHLLDDDKTLLVIFDEEQPPAQMPEEYYEGPDWGIVYRMLTDKAAAPVGAALELPIGAAGPLALDDWLDTGPRGDARAGGDPAAGDAGAPDDMIEAAAGLIAYGSSLALKAGTLVGTRVADALMGRLEPPAEGGGPPDRPGE